MPMGLPHRIAIVGAGPIGSALAGHLVLAGDKVTIGARRPDAFTPPVLITENQVAFATAAAGLGRNLTAPCTRLFRGVADVSGDGPTVTARD
jgi:2-polyprenyl-6-methoxyphenol hydroxylase-like FAD-dependent oxidoreductase